MLSKEAVLKISSARKPGSRLPNDIDKAVGAKLRKFRMIAGMNLEDLAGLIGMSHQQLQKYETGKNRISAGLLPVIADALGVDLMDFYEDASSLRPDSNDKISGLRRECQVWLRRAESERTLRSMQRVLKVLATQAKIGP
jgi:transcriptional regulator with XRE-family HTH domain